jgi:phage host-nuclease inhibitor protein Gam
MAARKKPANLVHIKDLKEADNALLQLASNTRALQRLQGDLNKRIDKLKAQFEQDSRQLVASSEALGNGLHAYAEHNKAELFVKRRSVELTFGTIGYRESSEVKPVPKSTWEKVLAALVRGNYDQAIRVKAEVDKEALRTFSAKELSEVGARMVTKDTFWFELKQEQLVDAAG